MQLSPKCQAVVVLQYWHGMSYEEIAAAARSLDSHGQEVSEPGLDALPAPHGAAGVSRMATTRNGCADLIAQQAADWFVANRAGLSAREREDFAAWLKASPLHVEEYLGFAVIARDLRDVCRDPPRVARGLSPAPGRRARARSWLSGRDLATPRDLPARRWHAAGVRFALCALLARACSALV